MDRAPLQNRVTPFGDIVATSARGTLMGNRGGRLHEADKRLGQRRWVSSQWICCQLSFKNRHRKIMSVKSYTELFFLDEATALGAGHRPCFECRRTDAVLFADALSAVTKNRRRLKAAEIDRHLHAARLLPDGTKRTYSAAVKTLPAGVMIHANEKIVLIRSAKEHWSWSVTGYLPISRVNGQVEVLTPKPTVYAIHQGYRPSLHVSILSA